jgi:hypothetical protein
MRTIFIIVHIAGIVAYIHIWGSHLLIDVACSTITIIYHTNTDRTDAHITTHIFFSQNKNRKSTTTNTCCCSLLSLCLKKFPGFFLCAAFFTDGMDSDSSVHQENTHTDIPTVYIERERKKGTQNHHHRSTQSTVNTEI